MSRTNHRKFAHLLSKIVCSGRVVTISHALAKYADKVADGIKLVLLHHGSGSRWRHCSL